MPRLRTVSLLALALGFAAVVGVARPAPAGDGPPDAEAVYQAALERTLGVEKQLVDTLAKVRPASVSVLIMVDAPVPKGSTEKPARRLGGCGSGVVVTWSSKTWIITNFHVAGEAAGLEVVTLDGKHHSAKLVDSVKHYDIALLQFTDKTSAYVKGVPVVPRASKELMEGQWVLATGNPFFLATDGRSVSTLGVVSGLGRVLGSGELLYGNAIQHDAAVNPGNSGGPLWNLKGELIGINGMISSRGGGGVGASNTGASFSIPIDQIQPYLSKLADAKQDAQAGFLGLATETSTDQKGTPNGARVTAVDPRSPARGPADGGLVAGDVIVSISIAGKPVTVATSTDIVNALTSCPAATAIRISYKRGNKSATWSGKLGAEQ
ncbi:MAG: trypsin-like peptidase domain-containing protein [Planctomycetes bacterium]|nr:trypsin-like peptidase domain-containing protein [Planctomycetota bacterium]